MHFHCPIESCNKSVKLCGFEVIATFNINVIYRKSNTVLLNIRWHSLIYRLFHATQLRIDLVY